MINLKVYSNNPKALDEFITLAFRSSLFAGQIKSVRDIREAIKKNPLIPMFAKGYNDLVAAKLGRDVVDNTLGTGGASEFDFNYSMDHIDKIRDMSLKAFDIGEVINSYVDKSDRYLAGINEAVIAQPTTALVNYNQDVINCFKADNNGNPVYGTTISLKLDMPVTCLNTSVHEEGKTSLTISINDFIEHLNNDIKFMAVCELEGRKLKWETGKEFYDSRKESLLYTVSEIDFNDYTGNSFPILRFNPGSNTVTPMVVEEVSKEVGQPIDVGPEVTIEKPKTHTATTHGGIEITFEDPQPQKQASHTHEEPKDKYSDIDELEMEFEEYEDLDDKGTGNKYKTVSSYNNIDWN